MFELGEESNVLKKRAALLSKTCKLLLNEEAEILFESRTSLL